MVWILAGISIGLEVASCFIPGPIGTALGTTAKIVEGVNLVTGGAVVK